MSGMNKYDDAAGDFGTPEQEILEETSDYDWESCMTMNDTWGYRKDDDNWKSSEQLIYNLIDVTAKGGNYLLNVGPMANGEIPKESIARLKDIGNWVKINGEAIYSSSRWKPFKQDNIFFTLSKDEKFIYAILTEEISDGKIKINGFLPFEDSEITHLGTNKKVNWEKLSETKFSINFPQIEDFGFGQTLKIRVK
jgi:alpha-L-fucosidase